MHYAKAGACDLSWTAKALVLTYFCSCVFSPFYRSDQVGVAVSRFRRSRPAPERKVSGYIQKTFATDLRFELASAELTHLYETEEGRWHRWDKPKTET